MVRELNDQNAILRYQPNQRDQSHLAVDVERRQPEERKHQRPGKSQRYRTHENNERIAEALELRRQHQVNQDSRQQEHTEELAPLHAKLARLARVVDGEALRQNLFGLILQETQ